MPFQMFKQAWAFRTPVAYSGINCLSANSSSSRFVRENHQGIQRAVGGSRMFSLRPPNLQARQTLAV